MTTIEQSIASSITSNWSITGTIALTTSKYLLDHNGGLPPKTAGAHIIILPGNQVNEQITYSWENYEYEGELYAYTQSLATAEAVKDELIRIGNAITRATGAHVLTFVLIQLMGDRVHDNEFAAHMRWKYIKKAQNLNI